MRPTSPSIALSCCLLLAGCGTDKPSDQGPVDDTSAPSTTDAAWVSPVGFQVHGAFAYDPDTDTAHYYYSDLFDELPLQPWITQAFEEVDSESGETTECAVITQMGDDLPRASWATGTVDGVALRFGVEIGPEPGGGDNCHGWDPEVWGEDITTRVLSSTWGLAISEIQPGLLAEGDPLSLRDAIVAEHGLAEWEEEWEPYVLGAGVRWSGLDDTSNGLSMWGYAFALEVDADWILVEAETTTQRSAGDVVLITREEVMAAPTLPRAVYAVSPWVVFDPAGL